MRETSFYSNIRMAVRARIAIRSDQAATSVCRATSWALCCELKGSAAWGARMRRREFVGLLGGAAVAWPLAARAQPADRVPRIGALFSGTVEQMRAAFGDDPFGLRDLGYIEGKTIDIERRFADGRADRLPALAAELVALKPDVIIAYGEGVPAVRRATSTIPIVMAVGPDVVGLGFAASFAHPGGNITGTTFFPFESYAKRLELLKRVVPSLTRCGVLML